MGDHRLYVTAQEMTEEKVLEMIRAASDVLEGSVHPPRSAASEHGKMLASVLPRLSEVPFTSHHLRSVCANGECYEVRTVRASSSVASFHCTSGSLCANQVAIEPTGRVRVVGDADEKEFESVNAAADHLKDAGVPVAPTHYTVTDDGKVREPRARYGASSGGLTPLPAQEWASLIETVDEIVNQLSAGHAVSMRPREVVLDGPREHIAAQMLHHAKGAMEDAKADAHQDKAAIMALLYALKNGESQMYTCKNGVVVRVGVNYDGSVQVTVGDKKLTPYDTRGDAGKLWDDLTPYVRGSLSLTATPAAAAAFKGLRDRAVGLMNQHGKLHFKPGDEEVFFAQGSYA